MNTRLTRFMKRFRRDETGVTSLEYCILFGGITFVILIGGLNAVAPGINDRLGKAFDPEVVLSGDGYCPAHNKGNNEDTGNCGVGLGGGNGTPNEGNGVGPGKEKTDNPGKGHTDDSSS